MHPVAFLPQVFRLLTDFGANREALPNRRHRFATPVPQMWIAG
jgi:hypothetical protein